ncbi:MAG: hypothetical protein M1823_000335 [Watsoniomyces obsoletus]|nr:MAG: hypothetical protein M1823_000335 [Watsoniomyces obsoletus]
MSAYPNEETIEQLLAMGLASSRQEAITRLQAHNNDLQRTVEAIFENPTNPLEMVHQSNDVWDERPFQSDRTNDGSRVSDPTYGGQPGHLQPHIFGAPSRPPSRVDGSRLIDLTPEHAAADPNTSFNAAHNREDEDLRLAMQLSMNDMGPQESGVTDTRVVQYGPAQRGGSDENQLSLTRQSSTHEIIIDPFQTERNFEMEQPAFLRPCPTAPYLAPLLTILHAIPLARKALLCLNHLPEHQPNVDNWWSTASTPVTIHRRNRGHGIESDRIAYDDIIFETQRLMAFLDASQRSYAGVEALLQIDLVREKEVDLVVTRFLSLWGDAVQRKTQSEESYELFISLGVKLLTATKQVLAQEPFSLLNLRLEESAEPEPQTIYQAMDDMIWQSPTVNDTSMAYLSHVGDIFTIRIGRYDERGRQLPRNVEIPFIWYPDRYLEENLDMATEIRRVRAETTVVLEEANRRLESLTQLKMSGSGSVDTKPLLGASMNVLEPSEWLAKTKDGKTKVPKISNRITKGRGRIEKPQHTPVAQKIKLVSNAIDEKMQRAEKEKQAAKEQLQDVANLFTDWTDDHTAQPHHSYTLRGVSTEPNVTYVLHPTRRGDTMRGGQTKDWNEPFWQYQWWRMSYTETHDPSNPIVTKMQVSEDDVLHAAHLECASGSVLLVYANPKAMNVTHWGELPGSLKEFIQNDNNLFTRDIHRQRGGYDGADDRDDHPPQHHSSRTEEMVEIDHRRRLVVGSRNGEEEEGSGQVRRASSEDSTEVQWGGMTPPSPPVDQNLDFAGPISVSVPVSVPVSGSGSGGAGGEKGGGMEKEMEEVRGGGSGEGDGNGNGEEEKK